MAWCAGRAGAIADLALGFSDYEDFVETDGIDRERYRELAELRADVAAALAACGPRLRSLALDDAYGAVKLGHSPTVQFLLGGCLRGLRELRMPVPEAATWRALAGLTALTALTADSTGAIATGTANYGVATPLPPALVSLLLEVALDDQFGEEPGPAWRLPAALSELQLTRLALLRGDRQRENSEYVHDADWALLASLTTLRRLELAAALTLTSLAGVGALTRLEHLDLRRACAPTDVANEDYHYCPSSLDLEVRRRAAPAYCRGAALRHFAFFSPRPPRRSSRAFRACARFACRARPFPPRSPRAPCCASSGTLTATCPSRPARTSRASSACTWAGIGRALGAGTSRGSTRRRPRRTS